MTLLQQLWDMDVQFSIIQAPMAGVQDSRLAIAVAEAGGIGSLPCAMLSPQQVETELEAISAATNKPTVLNFFSHQSPIIDMDVENNWRRLLAPYYQEQGLDKKQIENGIARAPFTHAIADIIEPFKPEIISFHFGLPEAELLARVKKWGCRIISSATTLQEALYLQRAGVDAIIAQGIEAGGHRGSFLAQSLDDQPSTLTLLQEITSNVDVPVIASGGIANAEDVRQCIELGASAAQVGTSFLCCDEATTTSVHRQLLLNRSKPQTAITNLFTGRPARGIVNRLMADIGPMNEAAPQFPLAANAIAPLRQSSLRQESPDFLPLWAGTNMSGCKASSAKEITLELAKGLP